MLNQTRRQKYCILSRFMPACTSAYAMHLICFLICFTNGNIREEYISTM